MTTWLPSALVNHVWQSTLFVIVVWLATLALRRNRARVRHWLWTAASVKFLVPFSLLVSLGAQFEWRTAPAIAQPAATFVIEEVFAPPVLPTGVALAARSEASIVPWVLVAVWLVGVAAVLVWWSRQWQPLRGAVREARPLHLDSQYDVSGLAVMVSSWTFEPGVVGIWRSVLLLPDGLVDRLTPAQMNALIAHERSHIRSHDNLVAAVHMAVEAMFWFHPLVWWIEKRMVDERERACDEAVLQSGAARYDYAEGILEVCRRSVSSPLICVAGVAGSDLRRRIESIMLGTPGRPMTFGQRAVLALAVTIVLTGPVIAGAMNAPLRANREAAQARLTGGPRTQFEVASIQPNIPSTQTPTSRVEVASVKVNQSGESGARLRPQPDGGIIAVNMPLRGLIEFAYQLPAHRVVGIPESAGNIRYDIEAKPTATSTPSAGWLPAALMRSVLEERFGLGVHHETRESPIYELRVSQPGRALGPKLTKSDRDCRPGRVAVPLAPAQPNEVPCGVGVGLASMTAGGVPLADFADALGRIIGRPVLDRTGLAGTFDLEIKFSPESQQPVNLPPGIVPPRIDPDAPSIFTAVQEQLGLKLEPARGPVEVLVIDSLERPTPD